MTCEHGFIGACAECDGCGQRPERDEGHCPTICLGPEGVEELDAMLRPPYDYHSSTTARAFARVWPKNDGEVMVAADLNEWRENEILRNAVQDLMGNERAATFGVFTPGGFCLDVWDRIAQAWQSGLPSDRGE